MQPLPPARAPLPRTLMALSPQSQSRQSLKRYGAIAALAGAQAVVDAVNRGQTLPPPPPPDMGAAPGMAPVPAGGLPPLPGGGSLPPLPGSPTPGVLSTAPAGGTSALPPPAAPGPGAPALPAGGGAPASTAPVLSPPPAGSVHPRAYATGGAVPGPSPMAAQRPAQPLLPGVVPAAAIVQAVMRAGRPERFAVGGAVDMPAPDMTAAMPPPNVGGSVDALPAAGVPDAAGAPPPVADTTDVPPAFLDWLQNARPADELGQTLQQAADQGASPAELWAVVQQLARSDPGSLSPDLRQMAGVSGRGAPPPEAARMGPPGTGPLPDAMNAPPPPRMVA